MTLMRLIKTIAIGITLVILQPTAANEFSLGKVIAYPNPFSPESEILTVKPESGTFNGTVDFKVYNFNEKMVFSGQTSGAVITWNGHTADGKRLIPGLYFIKIIQTRGSDNASGTAILKLIVK